MTTEDLVVSALLGQTVGQLLLGLSLGKTVDVAVVVVLDRAVSLTAGIENLGDITADLTGTGNIVDRNLPRESAGGGGGGGSGSDGHYGSEVIVKKLDSTDLEEEQDSRVKANRKGEVR